jgi:methionyl-tRNA formyltransferase
MSKFRILFLGTPDFAAISLGALIADPHFEIVGVVSQPDRPSGRKMQLKPSPVKELALAHGLTVLTPETVNTDEFRAQIAALSADSAAVVAFGQILGQKFLDLFPHGMVNVHGSLLPRWRGAAPIQRAIMAGDKVTGVALQIIVKKLDAGPVLGSRQIDLTNDIDAVELYGKLQLLGADLLHVEYMDYLRGHLIPQAQDESLVTIAPKIDKAEARINWALSAEQIFNNIRGLAMGPFAYAVRSEQPLKIHKTRVVEAIGAKGAPGEVLSVSTGSFQIACGQGILEVLEVQPESRSRQAVSDYLRGYPMQAGEKFAQP